VNAAPDHELEAARCALALFLGAFTAINPDVRMGEPLLFARSRHGDEFKVTLRQLLTVAGVTAHLEADPSCESEASP